MILAPQRDAQSGRFGASAGYESCRTTAQRQPSDLAGRRVVRCARYRARRDRRAFVRQLVAREAAIAHPQRVTSLVLIGTGFSTRTPLTAGLQEALRTLPDPIPEPFAREFQASTAYRPLPPEFFVHSTFESDGLVAAKPVQS
jgi:hypothetical protein